MFNFGIFTTIVPYILVAITYVAAFGYYLVNKPHTNDTQEASIVIEESEKRVETVNTENHYFYYQKEEFKKENLTPVINSNQVYRYAFFQNVQSCTIAYSMFCRPPPVQFI